MPELDLDLIRHALKTAQSNRFQVVDLEVGEGHFHAVLGKQKSRPSHVSASEAKVAEPVAVKSHFVGYYQQLEFPAPLGRAVQAGDVLGVVVALGLANDVEATVNGRVVEVLVEEGEAVEYGRALFLIELDEA